MYCLTCHHVHGPEVCDICFDIDCRINGYQEDLGICYGPFGVHPDSHLGAVRD